MKTTLISTLILLASMKLFAPNDSFKIPKEWDKSFVISVSHTGSMSGASSHLTLKYDSGEYVRSPMEGPEIKRVFAMSQADREKILKQLDALKVSKIRESHSLAVQNDGWSDVLCIGSHCIEGGSASKMSDKDKEIFVSAFGYLEQFGSSK